MPPPSSQLVLPQNRDPRLVLYEEYEALAVMAHFALFGPSDPDCGAENVSQACRLLSGNGPGLNVILLRAISRPLSRRILEHFGLTQPQVSGDVRALILLSFAAAGVASCPWPEGAGSRAAALLPILLFARQFLSEALPQTPNSAMEGAGGLVLGIGLRVARLCMAFARMGEEGAAVHRAVQDLLEDLASGPDNQSAPLHAILSSMDTWKDQHLEFVSDEASSFVLSAAHFVGEQGPAISDDLPSAERYLGLIAYLLHWKRHGNPESEVYTGKRNNICFHQILEDRLYRSPPPADDPSGLESFFPLDPVRLLESTLRFYGPQSQPSLLHYIILLLMSCWDESQRLFDSLDCLQIATLTGLLVQFTSGTCSILRDPSIILNDNDTGFIYSALYHCVRLIRFLVFTTGRISPVDLAKAGGDALSDFIRLSIDLPRMNPETAKSLENNRVLDSFTEVLPNIFTPLFDNPVSRAELMRATMRSGTLDRLRAALRAIEPYARTRPTDPAPDPPSVILGLSVSSCESLRSLRNLSFAICLNSLCTKAEREVGGLGSLGGNTMGALTSLAEVPLSIKAAPYDVCYFIFELRFTLSSLRLGKPTGAQLLADKNLDLAPFFDVLERAAAAAPEAGGGWATQVLADAVFILHGIVSGGLEEATRHVQSQVQDRGRGGRSAGRGRLGRLGLRAVESQYLRWRNRLRALGRRLLLEYLPRAERRDEAAWVLSPEEVVGLMRRSARQ